MYRPRHAQSSAFRRALKTSPKALSAGALAVAVSLPLLSAAPSSAAPIESASTAPIVLPADNVLSSVTQYAKTNVNVRSGPSTSKSIVGSYARGSKVTGTWTSSGWLNLGGGKYISGTVLTNGGSSKSVTKYTRTSVNVRSGSSTGNSIVGSYAKGSKVNGTMTSNGWLNLGGGKYISGTVLVNNKPGGGGGGGDVTRYARTNVNVRSGPGTSHSVVGSHDEGTKLTGTMTSSGWLKTGSTSFVSSAVLTKNGGGGGGGSVSGSAVLEEGRKYFGIMYRGGGSSPSTGFDCSGYTQYVYQQLGISLPRTTTGQRSAATPVSNPQPGDLVFWGSPAYHVAIYAGDGYIYDSGKPGLPVQKRKMFSGVSGFGRVL